MITKTNDIPVYWQALQLRPFPRCLGSSAALTLAPGSAAAGMRVLSARQGIPEAATVRSLLCLLRCIYFLKVCDAREISHEGRRHHLMSHRSTTSEGLGTGARKAVVVTNVVVTKPKQCHCQRPQELSSTMCK